WPRSEQRTTTTTSQVAVGGLSVEDSSRSAGAPGSPSTSQVAVGGLSVEERRSTRRSTRSACVAGRRWRLLRRRIDETKTEAGERSRSSALAASPSQNCPADA